MREGRATRGAKYTRNRKTTYRVPDISGLICTLQYRRGVARAMTDSNDVGQSDFKPLWKVQRQMYRERKPIFACSKETA